MDMEYRVSHQRSGEDEIRALPECDMLQFRRIVRSGGTPAFVLTPESTLLKPAWFLLVKDKDGDTKRVTTPTNPIVRRLDSIRQVYQVARECGFPMLHIPVELRKAR